MTSKGHYIFFIIAPIIFVWSWYMQASEARSLSSVQAGAIHNYRTISGVDIRVVINEQDNRTKTVVIVGESYLKEKAEFAALEELKDYFSLYGFDGAKLSKYWAEGMPMKAMLFSLHLGIDYFYEPSAKSIYLTKLRTINQLSQVCAELEKAFNPKVLSALFAGESEFIEIGGQSFNREDLKTVYKQMKAKDICNAEASKMIELEDHAAVTLIENLAMLIIPTYFSVFKGSQCARLLARGGSNRWLNGLHKGTLGFLKWAGIYIGIDMLSRYFFGKASWQDNLFILSTGLLFKRNEKIANGIYKGFKENPNRINMLVIVKRGHAEAVQKILMEKYGYTNYAK